MWCTVVSGCTHTTRPDSPLQESAIVDYSGSPDGLGNQTMPSFAVQLSAGHVDIEMPQSVVTSNSWEFDIDFQMQYSIIFTTNPSSWSNSRELVQGFALEADPGDPDGGFTTTITVTSTPL